MENLEDKIELAAELYVRNHRDFKAEGFSDYMNGLLNGFSVGAKSPEAKAFHTQGMILTGNKYETFKQAGYQYFHKTIYGHILMNLHTEELEVFKNSKNYAGWALIYKNTHLEFCHTLNNKEA